MAHLNNSLYKVLDVVKRTKSVKYFGVIGSYNDRVEFSDLDIVIITDNNNLFKNQLKLKLIVYRLKLLMIHLDPIQHHDFVYYGRLESCNIPISVLNDAFVKNNFLNENKKVVYSNIETHIEGLRNLFNNIEYNDYYFKLIISSILLIPLRVCNSNNIECSKKESFNIYKKYTEKKIIDLVTYSESIRLKWSKQPINILHNILSYVFPSYKLSRKLRFFYKRNIHLLQNEFENLKELYEKSSNI